MCHGADRARHARGTVAADHRLTDRLAAAQAHHRLWQRAHAAHRPHQRRADLRHPRVSRWRSTAALSRQRSGGAADPAVRAGGGFRRRAARAGAADAPGRWACRTTRKEQARPAQRYFTDYGLGYPYLLAPPWSTIIAYDLNRGVIKWRKPLGQDRDVTKAGGKNTGLPRGSQRQGMIVTSTGIVFSTGARRRAVRLRRGQWRSAVVGTSCPWARKDCRPRYQVKGKTYIVVNATTPHTWGLNSRESGIGSPEPLGKGGYVVFALPEGKADR